MPPLDAADPTMLYAAAFTLTFGVGLYLGRLLQRFQDAPWKASLRDQLRRANAEIDCLQQFARGCVHRTPNGGA